MSVTKICSVQELTDAVGGLRQSGDWRWLFRGQREAGKDLLPSVHRYYSEEEERNLTQEFRARAGVRHSHRPRYDDNADWLALMQHYGLPTRLLDWSHSPLTAAFFAVERALPHFTPRVTTYQDAAIWALCPGKLNEAQGLRPLIYALNSRDLGRLVKGAFFPVGETIPVAAAMAVETDVRMQVQRGAFTVHGTRIPLNQMQGCDTWLRKFIVPASCVEKVGREIDALGLGLADLFPDLGSLAKDLAARFRRPAV